MRQQEVLLVLAVPLPTIWKVVLAPMMPSFDRTVFRSLEPICWYCKCTSAWKCLTNDCSTDVDIVISLLTVNVKNDVIGQR